MTRPSRSRGRLRALVVLILGAVLLVSACGGGGGGGKKANAQNANGSSGGSSGGSTGGSSNGPSTPGSDDATITVTPADGTTGVDPTSAINVAVGTGDNLTSVKVTNASGQPVDGALASDGKTWKPKVPFSYGGKYTVSATANNPSGSPTTATVSFSTLEPNHKINASFFPDDGTTVGVGQPISIRFDGAIKNKAAVEKALTVTTSPALTGSWHWFGSQRVDWRPKTPAGQYWPTGTHVTVGLNLRGVDLGNGAASTTYKTFSFNISQNKIVSVVDVNTKTMTVKENDQVIKTIPVTTGTVPKYATWGGVMVVEEKYTKTRMNSQTVGLGDEYDINDVPFATRITDSGTFVHGNYWSNPSVFGNQNASHGCISMTPDNAQWFYNNAADRGDIVQVINAQEKTVAPDNGYGDWNLSWSDWVAGSALGGGQ